MLAEIRNDLLYLLNILESIEKIHIYSKKAENAEDFFYENDQLNFNGALTLLANIGENVAKISSELKNTNPDIEWQDIKDFRNKVVHDYIGIDIFIVFRIIKNELDPLKNKIFDEKEFRLARESFYYCHIPFDEIKS
jgi:uncharacterized protein with HEPN domain